MPQTAKDEGVVDMVRLYGSYPAHFAYLARIEAIIAAHERLGRINDGLYTATCKELITQHEAARQLLLAEDDEAGWVQ